MAPSLRLALLILFLGIFSAGGANAQQGNRKARTSASPSATPGAPASAASPPGVADPTDEPSEPPPPPIPWVVGPSKVVLGHDLTMELPDGDAYVGGEDAKKLLEKNGNFHNDNLLGLVVGTDDASEWTVTIRYEEDGYVKDDEKLDSDAILQSLRDGTEEANKERVERGFLPLTVHGWRELPRYDRGPHHLVWGLDVATNEDVSVNYSTRILGRKGWVALNLLTAPEHLENDKPAVAKLLDVTGFDKGSRYEDHASGDKVAEYGLVGLVLGGAGVVALKAAKVGVIASFWKVILTGLIAAKKAVVLGFAAVVAFFKKLFGRKPKAKSEKEATSPQ